MKKVCILTAAAVLVIPFVSFSSVQAAEGPETPTFYDGYFAYKLVSKDGYLITEWDSNYEETVGKYKQPEFAEVDETKEIPVYCIENRYYGVDSNIVIPESSNSGCGFAPLDESVTNTDYYTAKESDWNGYYAQLVDYIGPKLSNVTIPEYLNDGTRVIGLDFYDYNGRSNVAQKGIRKVNIPSTVKNISISASALPDLEEIETTGGSDACKVVDGVLYSSDLTRMILFPAGRKSESVTIPEGVQQLASFSKNKYLKEITLPSSITILPNNGFLEGTSVEKINMPKASSRVYSENGILYWKDWSDKTKLVFYPTDKTDKSFTAPDNVIVDMNAFRKNEYLEELTVSEIDQETVESDNAGNLPNLKSITITGSKEEDPNYIPYVGIFSYDGVLYYANTESDFNKATIEEKLRGSARLVYYPQGRTDEFFEFPDGLNSTTYNELNDYVKAVYLHSDMSLHCENENVKYIYLEDDSASAYGNDKAEQKTGLSVEEAKADFEEIKNAPEATPTPDPEESETPESTTTPEPKPASGSSGNGGLIIGAVAAVAAIGAGIFIYLSKKKKSSAGQ
ncbi:MAG: leucine-rich repeat protein [Erysipelotrichaceae bacterium]|nr:leucine-rich repeat protein [Erysipelotrichaceae bacterium]